MSQVPYIFDLQLFWGADAKQTGQNNGNLQSQLIQTCTGLHYATAMNYFDGIAYGQENRVASFSENSSLRTFNYDAYGNMWEGDQAGSTFPVNAAAAGANLYNADNRRKRCGVRRRWERNLDPPLCGSVNCVTYDAEGRQLFNTPGSPSFGQSDWPVARSKHSSVKTAAQDLHSAGGEAAAARYRRS